MVLHKSWHGDVLKFERLDKGACRSGQDEIVVPYSGCDVSDESVDCHVNCQKILVTTYIFRLNEEKVYFWTSCWTLHLATALRGLDSPPRLQL